MCRLFVPVYIAFVDTEKRNQSAVPDRTPDSRCKVKDSTVLFLLLLTIVTFNIMLKTSKTFYNQPSSSRLRSTDIVQNNVCGVETSPESFLKVRSAGAPCRTTPSIHYPPYLMWSCYGNFHERLWKFRKIPETSCKTFRNMII